MLHTVFYRGYPGSGKSTHCKKHYPDAVVCSADHFFMKDGKYSFDPKMLPEAHRQCMQKFLRTMQEAHSSFALTQPQKVRYVVVDNTNLKLWELTPYLRVAEAYHCMVEIVEMRTPKSLCVSRNIHGVPQAAFDRMSMEDIPAFWNLFVSNGA